VTLLKIFRNQSLVTQKSSYVNVDYREHTLKSLNILKMLADVSSPYHMEPVCYCLTMRTLLGRMWAKCDAPK